MSPRSVRLTSPALRLRCVCDRSFQQHFSTSRNRTVPELSTFSKYPPEHPRFIEIPRPVQPQSVPRPYVKGRLPVPRQIFPESAPHKISPDHLSLTTPEPLPYNLERTPDERSKDIVEYKSRQADQRRRNFREGIRELHDRKGRVDRAVAARSARKIALNHAAQTAPEREDERLTNPTVLELDMPPRKMMIPDPNRERNLAIKRENVAMAQADQERERTEALHALYVNATSFITNQEQLDKAIDEAFDDTANFTNEETRGFNIWHHGEPETTAQMLGRSPLRYRRKELASESKENLTQRKIEDRLSRLGEELTGGKNLADKQAKGVNL